MATYSLDINAEEHFDFDIFSITCTESIYRVVHELNHALNIDLQLNDLLDFTHKEGEDFYFPLYTFIHDELNIEFNLLPNQTSFQPKKDTSKVIETDLFAGDIEQTTRLLPELENSDYFLLIKGDNRYLYNHAIFESIKLNPAFIIVHEVFIEDLKDKKSKGNLLF
ncbi:MAG: IPExxxVDY family protein [Bacteroidia bacterium]|nr:IPExxxVDY family protein [Bacteroidia bacterium]